MNSVSLIGRLTKDPDLRYTSNGVAVTNCTIAINRTFKSVNGDYEADFINCLTWRKSAENLATYMGKGQQIGVIGRIQTRSYDGQDGKKVYVTEVVADNVTFLEKGSKTQNNNLNTQNNQRQSNQQLDQGNTFQNNNQNQSMHRSDAAY